MRPKVLAVLISGLIAAAVAGLIIVLAIFAPGYFLKKPTETGNNLPPSNIGGMELTQYVKGEEALVKINKLHGKNINLDGGYIADYGGEGNRAQLWAGEAASATQAKFLINRMIGRIKQKGQPFAHQRELEKEGLKIHLLSGMGQNHYVYQSSNKVIWLSVDPAKAEEALEDTLKEVDGKKD